MWSTHSKPPPTGSVLLSVCPHRAARGGLRARRPRATAKLSVVPLWSYTKKKLTLSRPFSSHCKRGVNKKENDVQLVSEWRGWVFSSWSTERSVERIGDGTVLRRWIRYGVSASARESWVGMGVTQSAPPPLPPVSPPPTHTPSLYKLTGKSIRGPNHMQNI